MPVRPIDANKLQELCNRRIQDTWNNGTAPVSWAHAYADFKDDIDSIPTLTPPNEPLTLDQLRQMNGEPVWGKSLIKDRPGEWFILRIVEMSKTWFVACAGSEQGFGDKDTYGETWIAFRRPPEEGEKT